MAEPTAEHATASKSIRTAHRPRLRMGSCLLEDAYAGNNTLLLRAGARISSYSKLIRLMQPDVRFGAHRSVDVPLDVVNEIELEHEAAKLHEETEDLEVRVQHAFALKKEAVQEVASVFTRIESSGVVDVGLARKTVSCFVNELIKDSFTLASLVQLKDADAYTLTHSVNVCILAMYVARMLGFEDLMQEVGTGALLHDIGKVRTPTSILQKPGPLDESEVRIIREHPTYGGELLLKSGDPSEISLECVLDHHERVSGGGYPRGKSARDLGLYAQVTGLADVYDALTTDRPYRRAMSPEDTLALMLHEMGGDLDKELLHYFTTLVGYIADEDRVRPYISSASADAGDQVQQPPQRIQVVSSSVVSIDTYR